MSQVALDQDVVLSGDQHQRKLLTMSNWFLSLRRQPKDKKANCQKRIQRSCADLTEDNQSNDIVARSSSDRKRIMKSKFYVPYASESVIPATNKSVDNLLDDQSETATSPIKNCMSCCPKLLSSNRETSSKLTATAAITTTAKAASANITNGEVHAFAQRSADLDSISSNLMPTVMKTTATGFPIDSMKDTIDNALRNYSLIQTSEIVKDEKITLSTSSASTLPNTCCLIQKKSEFHRTSRTTISTLESSGVLSYPIEVSVRSDDNAVTTSARNLRAALSSPGSGQTAAEEDPLAILEKDLKYIDDIALASRALDNPRSNSEFCLQDTIVNRLSSNSNTNQQQTGNDDNNNVLKLCVNGRGDSINSIRHSNNNICVVQGSQQHEVGLILWCS